MIHTLDHKNNASIGFPVSENLGIDTDNTDTGYIGEDTGILDFHI